MSKDEKIVVDAPKSFTIDITMDIRKNRGDGKDNGFCEMQVRYPCLDADDMRLVQNTVVGGLLNLGDPKVVTKEN